jgi:septin family protein
LVLLGDTGSGKSTCIHYLAGSEMKKTTINDLPHIEPIVNRYIPNIIDSVKCSPYSVSETRHINAIEISTNEKGKKIEIFLVDTPGFGDTRGPEVDIINGISTIQAIGTTLLLDR